MSKYSDHTTVGGQVLAHRMRMMRQNWHIIWLIGRISCFLSFLAYVLGKYTIKDIWNYLCLVKCFCRVNCHMLPNALFSKSYFWFNQVGWKEYSDYFIARNDAFLLIKAQMTTELWLALKFSICFGIITMIATVLLNKYFGKSLSDQKELISGAEYVSAQTLQREIREKSDITLAGVPYPKGAESRHTLITGTTGAGKTNVFNELLQQVIAKEERAIIVDTVGTYVSDYFRPDRDIMLNPLDLRSKSWDLCYECAGDQVLLNQIAECVIPDTNKHDIFWDEAARIVFIESMKKIILAGKGHKHLLQMLERPAPEWQVFLKDTYGASLMDKDAEKMAISIRATLINHLACFKYLKDSHDDQVSIKNWIQSGKGLLFFSCTPKQRSIISPMLGCWITIALRAMLQIAPTTNRTWIFIDELHNLGRLPELETSLAEIRKFGGCIVLGTQMISQLNNIYSREVAKTITGLCGTKVVMNVPEHETANYMSALLGEKEEISVIESISYGANTMRDGVNIAQQKEKKNIVSASDIMALGLGEAFIRFPTISLVGKVKFDYHEGDYRQIQNNVRCRLKDLLIRHKAPPIIVGEVCNQTQFFTRNRKLYGNDIEIHGLHFSAQALQYPMFIWGNEPVSDSCIGTLLQQARCKQIPVVIFAGEERLYSQFASAEDIIINPFSARDYGWDFAADFRYNSLIAEYIQNNVFVDAAEYLNAFKNIPLNDATDFLSLLCFAPLQEIEFVLQQHSLLSSNIANIRESIARELRFLRNMHSQKKAVSLSLNRNIVWVPCYANSSCAPIWHFMLTTLPVSIVALVHMSDSCNIKRGNTLVFNAEFNKFHTLFDGSLLALGNTNNNTEVAELFGETSITNIYFAGQYWRNINSPAVSATDLALGSRFFKFRDSNDVLKF